MRVVIARDVPRIGINDLAFASVVFRLGRRDMMQTRMNSQSLRLFDVRHSRWLHSFAKFRPRRGRVDIVARSFDFIATTPHRPSLLVHSSIPRAPTRTLLHSGHGQAGVLSVNILQLVDLLRRSPSAQFSAAATQGRAAGEVETGGYDFIPDGSSSLREAIDGTVAVYPDRTDDWGARPVAWPRD